MLECQAQQTFIPREERRRAVLPARLRCGAGWSDACILNVSSRGLMIYSKVAAHPGTTVEVRRGGQMVVARVVWRQNHRIGLKSQSPLEVDHLISDATAAAAVPAIAGGFNVERRTRQRHADRSRHVARAVEFLSVVVIGIVLAALSASTVYETIAKPVSAVQRALNPG